jgi:hypothetical protein
MPRHILPRHVSRISILIGCIAFASVRTTAQQVVHALVGTADSINSTAGTITIVNEDGTEITFRDLSNSKTPIEIDKALRADTMPVQSFNNKGTMAIVLFYGEGIERTAVALRSIGPGPFTKTVGTVVRFGGRDHLISIKDNSGAEQTFKLALDCVAETMMGAVAGKKFQPDKGDQVRVTSSLVNGNPTAFFVYAK